MIPAETLVVVNPASAGGRTGRQWPQLRRALRDAGIDFEHRLTGEPGEATELTRTGLRAGAARVVAVGGDGTLNEVLNGFFEPGGGAPLAPSAVLGLLPSGSGGDFRRTAGIPLDPGAASALLARGDRRPCDVGRIEFGGPRSPAGGVHHFINVADCGIGGQVSARVNASRKPLGGSAAFLYHSLTTLLTYRPRAVRVEVDGEIIEGPAQSVVVANGRSFGGGMLIAPDADLDDGVLDVVVLGDIPRHRALLELRRVYTGSHVRSPLVRVRRAREVRIEGLDGKPMLCEVDGEQIGAAPARVTVLSAAINLCAPLHRSTEASARGR